FFTGTGLGSAAFPTLNTAVVAFTTSPTLVGGGGTGPLTSILPWGLGSSVGGATPDTFVTIGANGVRPLNLATEYTTYSSPGTNKNILDGIGITIATVDS